MPSPADHTFEQVIIVTSLLVTGGSTLVNSIMLAFTYHRTDYSIRSATKAAVAFVLGVSYLASIGALALIRASELIRASGTMNGIDVSRIGTASVYAWTVTAILSLSITIVLFLPEALWRDFRRDNQR